MRQITPLLALVTALAVYRGTVLVLKDYISEFLRHSMRECGNRHLDYLSKCPWCSSMWVAAVIVPLTLWVSWWVVVDLILACSAVTGILLDSHKP
jgi:hypothetical protein